MRRIYLSNEKKRDAEVAFDKTTCRSTVYYRTSDGESTIQERRIKWTAQEDVDAIAQRAGDNLFQQLIENDPEVNIEHVGKKVEGLKKVYVTKNHDIAYSISIQQQVFDNKGTLIETRPESSMAGNLAIEGFPLRWTGKLVPREKAMRCLVFKRSYQIHHVNGLTYDFLYDMARKLDEANALMLLGAGEKGNQPLVMATGGSPYRAFLEGRVFDDSYILIMRITNLEMKSVS